MADDTKTSFGTKILLVLGAILAIWIAANVIGNVAGWIFSFFGYIVVAFVAYFVGKAAGRNDD